MDTNAIIDQANKLIEDFRECGENYGRFTGLFAKAKEFIRVYASPKSEFLAGLDEAKTYGFTPDHAEASAEVLEAFVNYVNDGFLSGISPKRKAQIDVVSDFLEQAIRLLDDKSVHSAVPAIIIGASLEEFLRNWVEAENLSLGNRKPGIDAYASTLRAEELITKQDMKDITSWAGLRNHAAHGDWEKVENKEYVRLVLEGVNLFMRKHESSQAV